MIFFFFWLFCVFPLYVCLFGRTGQPADQLLFLSVPSDSTSATLQSLQPDTEYVINLYPLFPRNSATPSTLNARTRESERNMLEPYCVLYRCFSLLCHVVTYVSAPGGGAAVIGGDTIRGQRGFAVGCRQRGSGLSCGLGSIYRSAPSQTQSNTLSSFYSVLTFVSPSNSSPCRSEF